jgi:PHB de-polymerase C-terminus
MQAGVGHYGVFSGERWRNRIHPILRNVNLSPLRVDKLRALLYGRCVTHSPGFHP